ncbi:MAG: hypothetical protein LUC40_00005, partial [Oscillospiraceae bacterium]|nr:hypothetical protein [Oscillospiraceae bacterium]
MKIVVGVTGASGAVYALRLMECLRAAGHEIHAVATDAGRRVLAHECGLNAKAFAAYADEIYPNGDVGARIASGSFRIDAMVVLPCSMHAAGALASG